MMANRKKATTKLRMQRKLLRAVSPAAQKLMEPPKLENIKRALFIQPHPDDNQIGAGGTIARLIDQGAEVWELTVLDDRYTDDTYTGQGLTVRQKEALASQACLGMRNAGFLGYGDRTRAPMREIADKITFIIRDIQPDAVFTIDPNLENECHEDHLKVARAVQTAVLDAEFSFLPARVDSAAGQKAANTCKVAAIGYYYTDKPNLLVDISDFEEKKMESIQCHASQMVPGFPALLKLQTQQFAMQTDYEAAEPLRMVSKMHTHCFNLPVGYAED